MVRFNRFSNLLLTTLIGGMLVPQVAFTQDYSCSNYWINPNTNKKECLDNVNSPSTPNNNNSSDIQNSNNSYNISTRRDCPRNTYSADKSSLERQELENFANAYHTLRELKSNLYSKRKEILQEEGITRDEYQKYIFNIDNESRLQLLFDKEELRKLNRVKNRIKQNQFSNRKLKQVIAEKGLNYSRYCEIMYIIRRDQELAEEYL